jgi:hypothetical protein
LVQEERLVMAYYKPRSHNFECDVCRDWRKAECKRKRWDGSVVCPDCWEPKPWFMHKYPKVEDLKPVRDARPQAEFTFIDTPWDDVWHAWDSVLENWEDTH